MLVITARIFKDNQLVGYQLSDGNVLRRFSKLETWMYAKNKVIANVIATGTEENPGLSGTNGFELKKLPELKDGDRTDQVRGHSISIENILREEYFKGVVAVGYKIKNISNEPIEIQRITADPGNHVMSVVILQPNETLNISKAELGLLTRRYGSMFANGNVRFTGNKDGKFYGIHGKDMEPTYENLSKNYTFMLGTNIRDYPNDEKSKQEYISKLSEIALDVRKEVPEDEILKYFVVIGVNSAAEYDHKKKEAQSILVENAIYNPAINVPMKAFMNDWVGFKIRNVGDSFLIIERITATSDHSKTYVRLEPNETMYVSKAELANFATLTNYEFANAKYYLFSKDSEKEVNSLMKEHGRVPYDILVRYFSLQGKGKGWIDTKINMYDILDEETINKYFRYTPSNKVNRNILVENTLTNTNVKAPIEMFMYGYKIRNLGVEPIEYLRITSTPDHSTHVEQLGPNETAFISRVELANLAYKTGNYFANGKLTHNNKSGKPFKELTYDEIFSSCSFTVGRKDFSFLNEEIKEKYVTLKVYDMVIDMYSEVDTETLNKYILYTSEKHKRLAEKKQSGAAQMFGMFKR